MLYTSLNGICSTHRRKAYDPHFVARHMLHISLQGVRSTHRCNSPSLLMCHVSFLCFDSSAFFVCACVLIPGAFFCHPPQQVHFKKNKMPHSYLHTCYQWLQARNYVQESQFPGFLDLVIWGHEHECKPDLEVRMTVQSGCLMPLGIVQKGVLCLLTCWWAAKCP